MVLTLPNEPERVLEPAHVNKQVYVEVQPISVDSVPQPLQEKSQIKLAVEKPSGSHQDWMNQAGIQPGDYAYVEYIISHESGWRPEAVNKSSGACGLVQALPCSKLGADWSNPIVALQWGDRYAKARYGSWARAHAFWQKSRWW